MAAEKRGVTVFVPALNEAENLPGAIHSVLRAAREAGNVPIEIIIVNDGSTDGTATIIRDFEKQYDFIRGIHHEKNAGWGVSFQEVVAAAKYGKIALYPGDGMMTSDTLRDMIHHAYAADFVCAYSVNKEARSGLRNFISSLYTLIFNITFRTPLKYINATPVYPVSVLRSLHVRCKRYSFPSEVTVKVLRAGCHYIEIPGYYNPSNMKSSALKLNNLIEAVATYFQLIYDVYVKYRKTYSRIPVLVKLSGT